MVSFSSTWRTFTSAPHRVMFLPGAIQGVVAILWWAVELAGRYGMLPQATWSVPSVWAHVFLMVYGFFPFFIFGFLFTTYPNWMNGHKIPARAYVPTFLLMSAGVLLFYVGLVAGKAALAAAVASMLAGWAVALYALLHVLFTTPHPDKRHPYVTSAALVMGWLGMASYLLWLLSDSFFLLDFARVAGIWFFLLPVFITVSHKMIPFFSSRVLDNYMPVRPFWVLWAMLACTAGHGILQLAQAGAWLWLFDAPFAGLALYLTVRWKFLRSFEVRLLAVLHIAFLWLGIALSLATIQSLALLLSGGTVHLFGLAPLHGLTIGLFASMVMGMVSRVTLGHSGRPLVADSATWALFLGFQATAVARVAAEILPLGGTASGHMLILAAAIWLGCFGPWVAKYAPVYWRPRPDGLPG